MRTELSVQWSGKQSQLLLEFIPKLTIVVLSEYPSSTVNIYVPVFAAGKAVAM
jgi:hypothetical protein